MEYQSYLDRSFLKDKAKKQIKGNIGILFLISGAAAGLLSLIPVAGPIVSTVIITPAFALSVYRIYLNLINKIRPEAGDAFSGFDDFWAAFKVNFLVGLFTYLWSLLFIIPGIVKGYSYSMSFYILAENKGKPALECITESRRMMDGHKAELFVLDVSFLGWILLGIVTLGIAYIWITPYWLATRANFYDNLKPKSAPVCDPEL